MAIRRHLQMGGRGRGRGRKGGRNGLISNFISRPVTGEMIIFSRKTNETMSQSGGGWKNGLLSHFSSLSLSIHFSTCILKKRRNRRRGRMEKEKKGIRKRKRSKVEGHQVFLTPRGPSRETVSSVSLPPPPPPPPPPLFHRVSIPSRGDNFPNDQSKSGDTRKKQEKNDIKKRKS